MKVCSRCKVDKPDTEFRLRRETRGKRGGGKLTYLNNTCRQCDSEITNKSYFKHKDDPEWLNKWREKSNKYYHNNSEKCKNKAKNHRDKSESKARRKEYDKKHADKIKADHKIVARRWLDYQRDNITDVYCIALIRSQNGGKVKCPVITQSMIEQKRLSIQIKRKLYELREKTITSGNNVRVNDVFPRISVDRSVQ